MENGKLPKCGNWEHRDNVMHVARLRDSDLYCVWDDPSDWMWYIECDELQECGSPHWGLRCDNPVWA